MKGKNLSITAILAIVAGVILIIANRSIYSTGVVITGGILFIAAGILNVFVFDNERRSDRRGRGAFASTLSLLSSIGAVVLGVCMIIFQDTFTVLVPYIFGIIVAFLACYQFYVLAIGARPTVLPVWFYFFPVLLLGAAIYIFFRRPDTDDHLITLASGIALSFFGLVTIIEAIMISDGRKKVNQETESASSYKPLQPLDPQTTSDESINSTSEHTDNP